MKNLLLTSLCAVACACSPSPSRAPTTSTPAPSVNHLLIVGHVEITPLGRGVYAAMRIDEPLGLAGNANSLFIVNDTGVVVVDAQFTRAATLDNIAALRRITRKPVRFVINTHWHDDHVAGNQVYQDSFPGVRFLAHANTRADLIARGRPNRAGQVQFAPGAVDRFERLLAMGLGGDSTPVSPLERASLTNAIRIVRQYVAESPGFREVLPDTIPGNRLTLMEGGRRIELRWFGRANTRGDLVAWLPDDGVIATGDLVVAPVPYAFASYPTEWMAALDSIEMLHPRVVVPGHGPLMRDLSYVATMRAMLSSAREQTFAAVRAGASRDSVMNRISLDDARARIAGNEKWMNAMFDMFFRRPVLTRLYDEASGQLLQ